MKYLLPALFLSVASAQQCVEVQQVQLLPPAVKPVKGPIVEYFERNGEGWTAGSIQNGERIGTWWFYQDENNWKKVTYIRGEVVRWKRLIAGRRLFEMNQPIDIAMNPWYTFTHMDVYELTWNPDRTLDWKLIESLIWDFNSTINEHGHFLNPDGSPNSRRTYFGDKYGWGDKFERTLMGCKHK